MSSSHFSLPVLYSSAHSDFEDESEYSYSNEPSVPQTLYLPIPDIPFQRKLIKEELKKFTDVIADQKIEINNQLLLLEEVQNEALCTITDKAKLFSEIIQLNNSLKKSKKSVDASLKIRIKDKADQCNQNVRTIDEENRKINQMVKENQKLSVQLETKTQNLIKDHDNLMNKFLNTVSYEAKRQIRCLNDKIESQQRRLQNVSEQYEKKIKEKDQIIADLRAQLCEAQKRTSNYVITKRERLKRPSMIIRDTTSILHQDNQNDKNEIPRQKSKENVSILANNNEENSDDDSYSDDDDDNDDKIQKNSKKTKRKKSDQYNSDEYNNSYNYSESRSTDHDLDSDD